MSVILYMRNVIVWKDPLAAFTLLLDVLEKENCRNTWSMV